MGCLLHLPGLMGKNNLEMLCGIEELHEAFVELFQSVIKVYREEDKDKKVSANSFNPFMPNGISHCSQLDQSISVLRVVRWYFTFLFKFQLNIL